MIERRVELARRGLEHAPGQQQAQVLLAGEHRQRRRVGLRRDHHLGEHRRDLRGRRLVERAIEGDDAAVGALRIAGERPGMRAREIGIDGDPAGVGVLDDRDRRRAELADQLEGGIGVGEVVVGQALALDLRRPRQRPAARRR